MPALWCIYYGDGTTWTGDPFLAPRTGVQVVKFANGSDRGYGLIHGHSAYVWMDDFTAWEGPELGQGRHFGWQGVDQPGFYDYLMHYRAPQAVLFGRVQYDDTYQDICRRAAADPL